MPTHEADNFGNDEMSRFETISRRWRLCRRRMIRYLGYIESEEEFCLLTDMLYGR